MVKDKSAFLGSLGGGVMEHGELNFQHNVVFFVNALVQRENVVPVVVGFHVQYVAFVGR